MKTVAFEVVYGSQLQYSSLFRERSRAEQFCVQQHGQAILRELVSRDEVKDFCDMLVHEEQQVVTH